jgi:hypothetical protein
LLLYSPRWLFLYPGLALMGLGLGIGLWLMPGPRHLGRIALDIHTLLYAVLFVLIGFHTVLFAFFTKVFATMEGLLPQDDRLNRVFRVLSLERGLAAGSVLTALGLSSACYSLFSWNQLGFGALDPVHMVRIIAAAMVFLTLGVELILSSFFFSILGLARK